MAAAPKSGLRELLDQLPTTRPVLPARTLRDFGAAQQGELSKGLAQGASSLTSMSLANKAQNLELAGDTAGFQDTLADQRRETQEGARYIGSTPSYKDVKGLRGALDYAAHGFGQGVMSMGPSIAAALLARGIGLGGLGAAAGAGLASYDTAKGEIVAGQYADPTLAAKPVEERAKAATIGGVASAAQESLTPAMVAGGLGGKALSSLGTAGKLGVAAGSEAATEYGQNITQQLADQSLDPTRELDYEKGIDDALVGAITGGGVSAIGQIPSLLPTRQTSEGPDPAPTPEDQEPVPVPGPAGKREPIVLPVANPLKKSWFDRATDSIQAGVDAAKGKVDEHLDNLVNNFRKPELEILRLGDNDPTLQGRTPQETLANLQARDQKRAELANSLLTELTADPTVAPALRDRAIQIDITQGPQANAAEIADLYETHQITTQLPQVFEALNEGKPPAPAPAGVNGIVFDGFKNLVKGIQEARAGVDMLAGRIAELAADTGPVTRPKLQAIAQLEDSLKLVADPSALATAVAQYLGIDPNESVLAKVLATKSAEPDATNPTSFLRSAMNNEAAKKLGIEGLSDLGRYFDYLVRGTVGKENVQKSLNAVAPLFNNEATARQVFDFYKNKVAALVAPRASASPVAPVAPVVLPQVAPAAPVAPTAPVEAPAAPAAPAAPMSKAEEGRVAAADLILTGKPPRLRDPNIIARVKANPNYNVENTLHGATIVGVQHPTTGRWVGKAPKSPVEIIEPVTPTQVAPPVVDVSNPLVEAEKIWDAATPDARKAMALRSGMTAQAAANYAKKPYAKIKLESRSLMAPVVTGVQPGKDPSAPKAPKTPKSVAPTAQGIQHYASTDPNEATFEVQLRDGTTFTASVSKMAGTDPGTMADRFQRAQREIANNPAVKPAQEFGRVVLPNGKEAGSSTNKAARNDIQRALAGFEDNATDFAAALESLLTKFEKSLPGSETRGDVRDAILRHHERYLSFDILDTKGHQNLEALAQAIEDMRSVENDEFIGLREAPGQSTMESRMRQGNGPSTAAQRQAAIDEVARIRGADVQVAFEAMTGGSGNYTISQDKVSRAIKIAINAANPMSVAWHESLHDFFAMMSETGWGPEVHKMRRALLDMAAHPRVARELRTLLANDPDAFAQAESNPEERLAYMYQFWAEGVLKLGPKTDTTLQKIAKFFRTLLNIVSQEEQAHNYLLALHEGKFAEPSAVNAALLTVHRNTAYDQVMKYTSVLGKGLDKMFTASTDRLRDMKFDAFIELADTFNVEAGSEVGKLGFLQSRRREVGVYLNRLEDALAGTTSEQRREATANMQAQKDPKSPLEDKLHSILSDLHDYMIKAGVQRFDPKTKSWVPMRKVARYMPRVWDGKAIAADKAGFVALFEPYMGAADTEALFQAIVHSGTGAIELAEGDGHIGFTPFAKAVNNRALTFINKNNAHEFVKYQSNDITQIMTTYLNQAAHRAEYARFFGNNGEVISKAMVEAVEQGATKAQILEAKKIVSSLEGTLGHELNPHIKDVMWGLITIQNAILLTLVMFSNLADVLGLAVRSGEFSEAWKASTYAMQGVVDAFKKNHPRDGAEELARTLGLIDAQNVLDAMGETYNSMYAQPMLKRASALFFKLNGLEFWNRRMRTAGVMTAQRFIIKNIGNLEFMKELGGLKAEDIVEMGDGRLAVTPLQIAAELNARGVTKTDAEIEAMSRKVSDAIYRFVEEAVFRPSSAHRPVWANDPHWMLVAHLKSFTFTFSRVMLRRITKQAEGGNLRPAQMSLAYIPFTMMTNMMRWSASGGVPSSMTFASMLSTGIDRSGLTGMWGFGAEATRDIKYGRLPGSNFLGPTADHALTLLGTIFGNVSAESAIARSLPFGRQIYNWTK